MIRNFTEYVSPYDGQPTSHQPNSPTHKNAHKKYEREIGIV
jgi:hypothetical protein